MKINMDEIIEYCGTKKGTGTNPGLIIMLIGSLLAAIVFNFLSGKQGDSGNLCNFHIAFFYHVHFILLETVTKRYSKNA